MTSHVTKWLGPVVAVTVAVALVAPGVSVLGTRRDGAATVGGLGPEGVPLEGAPALAHAGSPAPWRSVDGIV
ncbi:MAG: hypothetical protein ACXVZK_04940 [Gaiellaceae bacterium]